MVGADGHVPKGKGIHRHQCNREGFESADLEYSDRRDRSTPFMILYAYGQTIVPPMIPQSNST
ncbi:hypothetical protein [Egbenema bharatensis]|uniref:hypothetical protein n=1 Tax=Egbenema bharatensis TaxID=3463334 RepID=UPI003A8C1288